MIYRLRVDGEYSQPIQAKNLSIQDGVLMIEHVDDSIEWMPLTSLDSVMIGTNQPWTKVKVKNGDKQ